MAKNLRSVQQAATEMKSEAEFSSVFGDYTFVLDGGVTAEDGTVIELCESGQSKVLTKENAADYIQLYLRAYTKLDEL